MENHWNISSVFDLALSLFWFYYVCLSDFSKVGTSDPIYSSFALSGRYFIQNDGNVSLEAKADTSIKGFERLMAGGQYL